LSLQGTSLGEKHYGDPGLPSCQNPPLGLADVIQRKGETNTSGIRLTAVAARKVAKNILDCLWGYTPEFISGLTPLAFIKPMTNHKAMVLFDP